jgi:hypothetical protein
MSRHERGAEAMQPFEKRLRANHRPVLFAVERTHCGGFVGEGRHRIGELREPSIRHRQEANHHRLKGVLWRRLHWAHRTHALAGPLPARDRL